MLDLVFLICLLLWSIGTGRSLLRGLGAPTGGDVAIQALAIGLGLGTLSLATLALGLTGLLTTAGISVVLGLGLLATWKQWRIDHLGLIGWRHWRNVSVASWLDLGFGLALGGVLLGTLLVATLPTTDGDALCYHLQVPKVFLENRGLVYDPDLHETVYPLITELLYAVGLAIRGPIACRLIQWLFGVLLALGVAGLAHPILGRRAWWASTIALGVPAVSNGMSAPLNDVALAAYCNLALLGGLRWQARPTPANARVAGILCGLAIGVKYPALVWVGVLSAFPLVAGVGRLVGRRSEESNSGAPLGAWLGRAAWFGTPLLIIGGIWPARCFWYTGNPVFPFFREIFGSGLDVVLDPIKRPLPVNLGNMLTAMVPLTLQPVRFDSLAHQFGPVFLMALPGLLFLRPKSSVLTPLVIAYVFLTLCMTQRQSTRFLLAVVGPFSVAVAVLVNGWTRRGRAGALQAGLVVLLVLAESGLALSRVRQGWEFLLGRETVVEYLGRREPTWRVGRWIDQNLPEGARLIGQDHRGFYIPRPYTMELAHRRRTGLASRGESARAILDTLRDRGFTHLLLCPPIPENAVEFDPTLSRRLSDWIERQSPVFEETIGDADGVARAYAIYEL